MSGTPIQLCAGRFGAVHLARLLGAGRLAVTGGAVVVALAVLALTLHVLNGAASIPGVGYFWQSQFLAALAFGMTGALVAARQPRNAVGWLALLIGLSQGSSFLAAEYAVLALVARPGLLPGGEAAVWVHVWSWLPGYGLIVTLLLLLFPDGALPSRRWRPVAWISVLATAMATAQWAVAPYDSLDIPIVFGRLANPVAVPAAAEALGVGALAIIPCALLAVASLGVRFRRSRGVERQQVKYILLGGSLAVLLFGVAVFSAAFSVPVSTAEVVLALAMVPLPAATAVAVLRYRLWDIDLIINRSLVYGALTVMVLAVYAATVGLLSGLLGRTIGAPLVATVLVAVGVQPVRERLQRAVNRLLYGDRDDPYSALSRLGQRLQATAPPSDVLPDVAETVARALRLPYVAILSSDQPTAAYGVPQAADDQELRIPLTYRGEPVGELVAEPRAGSQGFSVQDRRLLDDLAHQVGVTVHAARLTHDLQRSRERLVLAREEERRRLRRDLHDQLGPDLAAAALELDRARELATTDLAAADKVFEDLGERIREAVRDVRHLVDDLRPPALDELGLLGALHEQVGRFANGPTSIMLQAPDELGPLPAAVDLAAYRIACEALTNVVRHAGASQCTVRLARTTRLELEVTDDGRGLPAEPRAGLGLSSMRERAAELGGKCTVTSTPGRGTQVCAWLPLSEP
jgi:signal transduction histidine kinase